MSHPMALPTVTAALRRSVLQAATTAVQGANVRLGSPTADLADGTSPLVNLHLYRVAPNPANINNNLPSRAGDGSIRGPSQLALDLSYILTFYGNAEDFEQERMLSEVILALEDRPLFGNDAFSAAIADAAPLLDESDLADAIARVRISRDLMSLEEVSKLWSIFYQVPYAVSVAFTASHVRIETQTPSHIPQPVAMRQVFAMPLSALRIDTVSGAPEPPEPVLWDQPMVISGNGLAAPGVTAEIGGRAFDLTGASVTATTLTVMLEDARLGGEVLPAGLHSLRLIGPLAANAPEATRPRSNAAALILAPTVVPGAVTVDTDNGDTIDGSIAVTISPGVFPGQAGRLLLDPHDPAATTGQISLDLAAPPEGDPHDTAFDVAVAGLPKGDYLVRVEIDGSPSSVTLGTDPQAPEFGQIVGPVVSVP